MRYQGRITRWHHGRRLGYITPNGGGDELFVSWLASARGSVFLHAFLQD